MAMEIQMTRRAGYAMKIKTPAETESRAGFLVRVETGWNRRDAGGKPRAQKKLSFNRAFAQVGVEIASV